MTKIFTVSVAVAVALLSVGFILNNGLIAVSSILSIISGFFACFLYEDRHE